MTEVLGAEIIFPIITCASWLDFFRQPICDLNTVYLSAKLDGVGGEVPFRRSIRLERPDERIVKFDTHPRCLFGYFIIIITIVINTRTRRRLRMMTSGLGIH